MTKENNDALCTTCGNWKNKNCEKGYLFKILQTTGKTPRERRECPLFNET